MDSVIPNPFTSVNDLIPVNKLDTLIEFAAYPSFWSTLHYVAYVKDEARIRQDV